MTFTNLSSRWKRTSLASGDDLVLNAFPAQRLSGSVTRSVFLTWLEGKDPNFADFRIHSHW